MKKTLLATSLGLVSLFAQAEESAVNLGEMAVAASGATQTDTTEPAANSYESFDPVDSGRSVISQQTVEEGREGGTDTTGLLESLPFVQMDIDRQSGEAEDVQSIRPSDFSISGGNYYDNNIMIDGVSATSIMDVTSTTRDDFNEVGGQTSQTLYVDPSLIGSVDVFDSNVSARYGNFIGGVVNYKLRQPAKKFGFRASAGYQNDNMVSYHKQGNGETTKTPPDFNKYQSSISFDLPLTDKLFVLASVTRSGSDVKYQMSENYGSREYDNGDTSSNYLLKALYEYSPDLNLEAQVIYSPYGSEYQPDDSINSESITHSDGLSSYIALNGTSGARTWQQKVSYQFSDASREWDGYRYSWPSKAASVDWCDSTNCAEGGHGDLDQKQQDTVYEFNVSQPLLGGDISFGSELRWTDARKVRPEDYYAYSLGTVMNSGVTAQCTSGDTACRDDVALRQYTYYQAYDAHVMLFSQAHWLEYFREFGDWDVRAGTRLSHDDFMDNYNLAPRLTTNWEFLPDTFLTMGANRYYAANMVGYAIRSQYPDSVIYRRTVSASTGAIGNWAAYSSARSYDYSQGDLDTPYSDELTAAITLPMPLNGHFRIKGVYRQNRDGFSNGEQSDESYTTVTGRTTTTTVYNLTNNGSSDYQGLSLEWDGRYQIHSFNANVLWSKTKTYGTANNYFDWDDPEDLVYYQGQLLNTDELADISARSNFAAPLKASIGVTSNWTERFMTSLRWNYRGHYQYLGDSGETITVDGTDYDVYEQVTLPSLVTVNLNSRYTFFKQQNQSASVDVKVTNLLNAIPRVESTSSTITYRTGRSVWLGVNYTY